jgi:hypothetical protein
MVMLREVPDDAEGLDQLKQVNAMHGATNRLIRAYPVVNVGNLGFQQE